MASTAASMDNRAADGAESEVSLVRLYVLRATYLLLVVGLGLTIVPALITHEPTTRGVIPSLLGGVWLLAFLGLRYPVQMLPLLMFEFAWKAIWMLDFGLRQWFIGEMPSTFNDDFFAIALGVILMPVVIPWGFVWHHYVKAPSTRWR